MKGIGFVALACTTALGLSAVAQAAGKVTYTGNLGQSSAPQATIKLNVRAKKDRSGKEIVKVTFVELRNATYRCSDGGEWAPGSTGGNQTDLSFFEPNVTLRGRSFSKTLLDESSALRVELRGTIPKHGQASGTVRLTEQVEPPLGFCDSGVVNWTAAPQ